MVDVVGWMSDWLTELAGSLTGLEQVCAGSSDHLAGEPWLTNLAHAAAAAAAGQSDRWSVICHSQPSAFHLEVIWGFRDLWADAQDTSRWFPALFFSSQHGFCAVLAPHTSLLCGKGRSRTKERKSHWTRERLYTQHMCTRHYRDPRGFTQAWCVLLSPVCDHPTPGSVVLITRNFLALLANTSLPEGSWLPPPFTSWNSQQNISHNIVKKRFKETWDEVRGVGRAVRVGGKRYGNVITIGSAEIPVGGDEESEGGKERVRVPKHYSPQVQSLLSCLHYQWFNFLFLLTTIPSYTCWDNLNRLCETNS